MPSFQGDAAPRRFIKIADLTEDDLCGFKPMRIEIEPKVATLNMCLPQKLLDAVKADACAREIPYTRYVRMILEKAVA